MSWSSEHQRWLRSHWDRSLQIPAPSSPDERNQIGPPPSLGGPGVSSSQPDTSSNEPLLDRDPNIVADADVPVSTEQDYIDWWNDSYALKDHWWPPSPPSRHLIMISMKTKVQNQERHL